MRFQGFLWGFLFLAFLALGGLLFGFRSYQVFTQEELVAVVQCEAPPKAAPYSFVLLVSSMVHGVAQPPQRFPMQGNQWSLGGDLLKWHPWLNLLGMRSCHKLTRLSSRYLKAEDEQARPRSVYELGGGTSRVWLALYRFQRWLPLIEAVYGNSAHTQAQPGTEWGVYVTLSGYLIKSLQ